MCIENVKLKQFKYRLETLELTEEQRKELEYKVEFQTVLVSDIKTRLLEALKDVFENKHYDYYKEKRSLV